MQKYRFADFELDLEAFELRLRGEPVKLERRPLNLLVLLVERAGQMVPREEIIAALWTPRVIIDFESGLNTLVRKVRTALGDSYEEPKFIERVPGRGYRFVAPIVVAAETDPASEALSRPPTPEQRAPLWRQAPIVAAFCSLLVAALALFVWLDIERPIGPMRIAVPRFENLTRSDELGYLAAGIAEDTSAALAQIDPENLVVVEFTAGAVDPALTVADIGRRFDVDYLVAGALRLDGTKVRLSARLLKVADGEQIGAWLLDRELTNPLGLERELSIAIAEQIRLRLSPEVAAAIARRQTQNPRAYALYHKGRDEWVRLTPHSIRQALDYFTQATDEDPSYALAWAGIAFAAITSIRTADAEPAAMKPIALDALHHAMELGPDLVETRYARGYYSLFGELDSFAAEQYARQAIELDANNPQAHMLLGMSLGGARPVEALQEMRRTRELDPMFALGFANTANVALSSGDPIGALEFATQAVAMSPEFWVGHYYLGRARAALGESDGALRAYADATRLSEGHSLTYSSSISLLISLSRVDEARFLLGELTAKTQRQYVPPYTLGANHALLGDTDEAFSWLSRAVEERDVALPSLPTDRRLDGIRDDPRFASLLLRCDCLAEADRRGRLVAN